MNFKKEKEPEPKAISRTNSGRMILFYPATKEVKIAKRTEYKDLHEPRDTAPKLGRWVNVYERNSNEKNRGLVLTTLNLSKLSWADSWRRLIGKCNDIYVVDSDNRSHPITPAAT